MTATDTQGASATTSAFGWTVTPAAPSKVVFTTQPPTSGTAGVALSSFAVSVEDQYGNVETTGNTGSADAIALSVHSGPGSITSGLSATASNGVATFAATVIDTAGSYTFTATDSSRSISTANSTPITVIAPSGTTSLTLSPGTASVAAGVGQAYTATGYDTYGNSTGNVTGSTTFSITPNGAGTGAACTGTSCTATKAGTYTVKGTDGAATGTATLTVTAGPTASLALSPANADVVAGGSQAYTATGYDTYGNTTGNVTGSTTFTIAPNGAGTGASCTGTSCTASALGSYTVTGTDGSATGSANLTVSAGPPATLTLSPASATVAAGTGQAYTATGYDSYGNTTGNVTGSTTFTIAPNGAGTGASCTGASCTATEAGTYTVTGTDGTATGTATLTVTAAAPATLVLDPTSASIVSGNDQSYTASGTDAYGNSNGDVTSSTTFTISPDGAGTGAVCTGPICTATKAGTYTVTGTDGSASATSSLVVRGATTMTVKTVATDDPSNVISIAYNTTVKYEVTVTGTNGSGAPTGTVSFSPTNTDCSAQPLSAGAGETATASCVTTIGSGGVGGSVTVTMDYGGDSTYAPSSGSSTLQVRGEQHAAVTTTLSPSQPANGEGTTITATVTGSTTDTPTGMVIFTNLTTKAAICGDVPVVATDGPAPYTATASCDVPFAGTVGGNGASFTVGAVYWGDANFTAASANQRVIQDGSGASTLSVTAPAGPLKLGARASLHATVGGSDGVATGKVQFLVNGSPASCAGTISATGSASCSYTTVSTGTQTVTATYAGSTTYAASTSSDSPTFDVVGTASVIVPKPSLSGTPTPVVEGSPITVTTTVSPGGGLSTTPTGTLTFNVSVNGVATDPAACTPVTVPGDPLSCTFTPTFSNDEGGPVKITASYSGDGTFEYATSSALTVNVLGT